MIIILKIYIKSIASVHKPPRRWGGITAKMWNVVENLACDSARCRRDELPGLASRQEREDDDLDEDNLQYEDVVQETLEDEDGG